ncbi:hypothetical protein ACLMJK_003133 [Lecanora helva]
MAAPIISSNGGPIFFFREFEEPYGYLSQWYPSSFTVPATKSTGSNTREMTFLTTEQYMMYQKAIIFKDYDIAKQIMLEPGPKRQKALGRKVKGFDHKKWDEEKEKVVEDGNWWKFTQPKEGDMRKLLLETGDRELVEASPFDRIWGVGYSAATAEQNRANWGENLLGKALMRVRSRLQT